MSRRSLLRVTLSAFLVAAGCDGGDGAGPELVATAISVASGNGQSGPAGSRLPAPLVVTVLDQFQDPLPLARVNWTITAGPAGGGAVLSSAFTVTNGLGSAAVDLTLGSATGTYGVTAVVADSPSLAAGFTATADPPPVLTAVTPDMFKGGDTLVLSGTGLAGTTQVEVGDGVARLVFTSDTEVRAVAPACLAPGTVSVRARIGAAATNALSKTYAADTIGLLVGEYAAVDPLQVSPCATFAANLTVDTIEYLLVPQAATLQTDQSADFRLQGDPAAVAARVPQPRPTPTLAQRFHEFLRQEESRNSRLPRPTWAIAAAPAAETAARPALGSSRRFKVCATLTCSRFDDVAATVKYVGEHAVIYQDNTAPAGGLTAAQFDTLGALFDQRLYGINAQAFGAESDIDGNRSVIVLFTGTVNGLVPEPDCNQGFVAGFFYAFDIDPIFSGDARSNRAEIFYTLVPDPSGQLTCSFSTDLVRRIVPVTFIHEFQHMISYNEHVLVRSAPSEELWLNEALSHFAEELGGRTYPPGTLEFSRFVLGDLFDAYKYLEDPGATFLATTSGIGSLAERGAGWLFVRYLVDRFGFQTTRRLVQTALVGRANVEAATEQPAGLLVSQWGLANWVSNLPGFTAPLELRYTSWAFRTTFQSLNSQDPTRFARPYPLIPLAVAGASFAVTGTLRSGSGVYARLLQPPGGGGGGVALRFESPGGTPLPAAVGPRLTILRIR